ncbi:MAG TPA: NADPH-dependent 7-cyano-7-deazaguanine reductase QueF [Deltaproteobacteria bacterium]|nr:NADPH-dependent 7-cyano-7-deazaguanine reductase QueF [Deltaproteobacteria bacterium]
MNDTLLGKTVASPRGHDPSILTPIPRPVRPAAMYGFDLWRAYELSWLGPRGCPRAAIMELIYPCESACLVESKSLKLYLNGLAYARFDSADEVEQTIRRDLNAILGAPWVSVTIFTAADSPALAWQTQAPGTSLDALAEVATREAPDPSLLTTADEFTAETLNSGLLRSLCPITGQPDWGSVVITYRGARINASGLLSYLCSFREHRGFHEACCERIFSDITARCAPQELLVGCFYTRRGGIDINPVRSSYPLKPQEFPRLRLIRQ